MIGGQSIYSACISYFQPEADEIEILMVFEDSIKAYRYNLYGLIESNGHYTYPTITYQDTLSYTLSYQPLLNIF
jgi:hypothetical protein